MYVVFRAEQPISHSKADTLNQGNYTTFRRLPLLLDNGIIEVPTISGNAIGGAMRRQAFRELYEIAEFSYNDEFKSSFSNEKKSKNSMG